LVYPKDYVSLQCRNKTSINLLIQEAMTVEELKQEIEKKEQMLKDYQDLAKDMKPKPTAEEYQRQINFLLDDLIKLRKRLEK